MRLGPPPCIAILVTVGRADVVCEKLAALGGAATSDGVKADRAAGLGPMIVVAAGSVSTSGPPITRIVRGRLSKTAGSNMMMSGPGWLLA
jgi:hypothetical protein